MYNFNYFNDIQDPTELVLQLPTSEEPFFLNEECSYHALNVCLDSSSFYYGMSYFQFVSQYVNKDIFSNPKNKAVLEDMLACANVIFEKLQVFKEIGIPFSFFIAGGSVRDLILNKIELIKDFDFYVSFDNFTNLERKAFTKNPTIKGIIEKYPEHLFAKSILSKKYSNTHFILSKEDHNLFLEQETLSQDVDISVNERTKQSPIWLYEDNFSWKLYLVLMSELIFADFNPQLYCQAKFLLVKENYAKLIKNQDLLGVLKIDVLGKSCDIMFTENNISYFSSFDWEICKAGFVLYNDKIPKPPVILKYITSQESEIPKDFFYDSHASFFTELPKKAEDFVSRFFSVGKFFEDIARKELTYMVKLKPSYLLVSEMHKRCQYLKNKYPDFKVSWNLDNIFPTHIKPENAHEHQDYQTILHLIEHEFLDKNIQPVKSTVKTKITKF